MTFCLNFLLECCEFEAEDEHTIDNFLLAALDAYEREYATAPAQPIEQPHLQSAFTSPTPITNRHLQTFRCMLLCQKKILSKHKWKVSPKKLVKTPSIVSRMAQLPPTTHYWHYTTASRDDKH